MGPNASERYFKEHDLEERFAIFEKQVMIDFTTLFSIFQITLLSMRIEDVIF